MHQDEGRGRQEDKVMKSAAHLFAVGVVVLAGALFAGPATAQSQQVGIADPFSGMPSADNEQMSDVSGEAPGIADARTPAAVSGGNGGAVGTDVGSTTRDVSASGNGMTVNVTAINVQTSVIGSAVLNTSGGVNSAGTN
jgi:hypothetical protein